MSKRFSIGLVVGKFAPLHLGHEWLIRQAQEQCEQLVLLSWACPELAGYEPERRANWLQGSWNASQNSAAAAAGSDWR